jgi:hypothetical protein
MKKAKVGYFDGKTYVTHCLECGKEIRVEKVGDKPVAKALRDKNGKPLLFLAKCVECISQEKEPVNTKKE